MFDASVTNKARVREVERNARQLADSISKLFDDDSRSGHDHDCEHCGSGKYRQKAEAWRRDARHKWDQSREMMKERGQQVDAYAHENVWKTVGIAAVLGAILGSSLMKRRR